jgi:protein-S-isoprenylcysteine O-methyltransferase Ste14
MKTLFVALRAAVFASLFFTLWAWVAGGVETLDARHALRFPSWTVLPGAALMAAGAALALCCVAVFATRGHGTPAPFDPPRRFVAVGPYAWVRNPMYVGGAGVIVGWALVRHSPSLLLFAAAWLALAHLIVIGYEEPVLRAMFGEPYEAYLQRVPRWLPRRSRGAPSIGSFHRTLLE